MGVELIEATALSKGLKFRIYETDRGIHAYCTSRVFHFREKSTLMLMNDFKCDKFYTAFVAHRGFTFRISPKNFQAKEDVDAQSPKPADEFETEYVKKPWIKPVVGSAPEDPALVLMADMSYKLVQFILGQPNLYKDVNSRLDVDDLLFRVTEEAVRLFSDAHVLEPEAMQRWCNENGVYNVPFMNDVMYWTRKKNGNSVTKHPVDGKPITVFSDWYPGTYAYVHNYNFSCSFDTEEEAKAAVKRQYGKLRPKNQQKRSSSINKPADAKSWKTNDVAVWISNLFTPPHSQQYADIFKKNGIDGQMLLQDVDQDGLVDLGIAVLIHRKKILRKIRELVSEREEQRHPKKKKNAIRKRRKTASEKEETRFPKTKKKRHPKEKKNVFGKRRKQSSEKKEKRHRHGLGSPARASDCV